MNRCNWCEKDDLYRQYHDTEWGRPQHDDAWLFEQLLLETFQAGLSWYTILTKREGFRRAFDGFDYHKIARYDEQKVTELLCNVEIVRNEFKVRAAIHNAQRFIEIQQTFGSFDAYIWAFVDGEPIVNSPRQLSDVPATTPLSDQIAKDLKKRGFKFLGSTTVYAFLQSMGIVNDHLVDCDFR